MATRKEAKEQTRRNLIEAVVQVLISDGLEALTTTKVARAAGVAQSSFYVHFPSMDAALEAVGEEIAERMRVSLQAERRKMIIENPLGAIRAVYAAALNTFVANKELAALYLRYRRDIGPLGTMFGRLWESSRQSIVSDLAAIGIKEGSVPHLEIYVDMAGAMADRAFEGLYDGRYQNIDDCLDVLESISAQVFMTAMMGAMRGVSRD